ncbi:MAG: M1 family metallopeptidase, partial [Cryomorphaceae bacterium]|nr:M1 family metallopeptidase [Cryomorphaceae bacterium]
VSSLNHDGEKAELESFGTVLKVHLPKPIPPDTKAQFDLQFDAQSPKQIRRSGRHNKEGIHYSMAQWYPKLANYDRFGWNTTPYVGREFYGIWGDYDVHINIDKKYTLAGTGVLQNAADIGHGYSDAKNKRGRGKQTWHFRAEQVHDFMWAADPEYLHVTHQVPGGPLLRFFYKEKDNEFTANWEAMPAYMERFFQLADSLVGPYPYPEFSFIQGGDGGMEYPMATLMLGRGKIKGMVGLAVHEAMHNWFYGMIATNESRYPWIDEGFTTFVENIIMMELFPDEDSRGLPHYSNYLSYLQQWSADATEPLTTPADHYITNRGYGVASYSQGCLYLVNMQYIIGEDVFWKGFRSFFNRWKFHHPHPEDFIREMERVSDVQLQWFNDLWVGTTQAIDIGIDTVFEADGFTHIVLRRYEELPFPATVALVSENLAPEIHHVPLDLMYGRKGESGKQHRPWKWAARTYTLKVERPLSEIDAIYVDPFFETSDVDRKNNMWSKEE